MEYRGHVCKDGVCTLFFLQNMKSHKTYPTDQVRTSPKSENARWGTQSLGVTVSPHHLCLPGFLVSHTQQPPTRARNSSDNLDNPNSAPNNSRSLGTRTRTKRSESLSFPELPTRIPMSEQHFLGKQWTFTTLSEVQRGWKDRATSRVTKFYFNFFFSSKPFLPFFFWRSVSHGYMFIGKMYKSIYRLSWAKYPTHLQWDDHYQYLNPSWIFRF